MGSLGVGVVVPLNKGEEPEMGFLLHGQMRSKVLGWWGFCQTEKDGGLEGRGFQYALGKKTGSRRGEKRGRLGAGGDFLLLLLGAISF